MAIDDATFKKNMASHRMLDFHKSPLESTNNYITPTTEIKEKCEDCGNKPRSIEIQNPKNKSKQMNICATCGALFYK